MIRGFISLFFISLFIFSHASLAFDRLKPKEQARHQVKKFVPIIEPVVAKQAKEPNLPVNPNPNQALENIVDFPDLSRSMLTSLNDGIEDTYTRLRVAAAEDQTKPLIAHIIMDKTVGPQFWETLIKKAFKDNNLSPADLMWIIDEYSEPKVLSERHSQELFQKIILNSLNNDKKREYLILLLTDITLHKEDGTLDETKKSWGYGSAFEYHNVLLRMIERGYIEALNEILTVWPSERNIYNLPSCKRDEQVGVEGWFGRRTYRYAAKIYSLAAWLMRDRKGIAHAYLDKNQYAKSRYIAAAKEILNRTLNETNQENINGLMFGMGALLSRQEQLPENISLEQVVARLSNFEDINIGSIPGGQRVEIEALLFGAKFDQWKELTRQ